MMGGCQKILREENKMKIRNKKSLANRLVKENYDVIAIWKNGQWNDVGTGYGGEQDEDNPIIKIRRSSYYDQFDNKTAAKQFLTQIEKADAN